MTISPETLKMIANEVLVRFKQMPANDLKEFLNMEDYHGFLKSRLPNEFLEAILNPFQLEPSDVQIEIVEVVTDLTHEIHYHQHAFAYCVCMDEEYNVRNPKNARAFLKDSWSPVSVGDIIEIPAGTPHGFTVEEGGTLTFLSVQAPPIVHADHDDYIRLKK